MEQEITRLRLLLTEKETQMNNLNERLHLLEKKNSTGEPAESLQGKGAEAIDEHTQSLQTNGPISTSLNNEDSSLNNEDISRYSRQLILPEIGPKGQLRLKKASVLIVGAGGLGCPAGIYLAAAGVGRLGVVDYDEVELNNLHRQVLHTEQRIGMAKCLSMAQACSDVNSSIKFEPYHTALYSSNAMEILKQYDVVVDATDNVATRYLLNDACVLSKLPLVSGSALRLEGQLTVYNHQDGPCYRCIFPKPPPPETVTNCSDGGVLGVVPGIIGCLQALEVIKILTGIGTTYSSRLLLFDALQGSFRNIKLRGRQQECRVCGTHPSITKLIDYEQFCGTKATDKTKDLTLLKPEDRISVQEFRDACVASQPHLLLDVRQPVELEICQLPNSYNIPIDKVDKKEQIESLSSKIKENALKSVFVVCRLGNDSQEAVLTLKEALKDMPVEIKDITGGLKAWARHINPSFPVY